jgi:hypothetical protein
VPPKAVLHFIILTKYFDFARFYYPIFFLPIYKGEVRWGFFLELAVVCCSNALWRNYIDFLEK